MHMETEFPYAVPGVLVCLAEENFAVSLFLAMLLCFTERVFMSFA